MLFIKYDLKEMKKMICPKCNSRMRCTDTYSIVDKKGVSKTARHHKCTCGNELYTLEQKGNILEVTGILAERQTYKRRKERRAK